MLQGFAEMFTAGKFYFELETPFEVVSSNATTRNGNKLVWDIPISSVVSENSILLEAVFAKD